jgi:DNA-binding transcriptional ArsR family regulator
MTRGADDDPDAGILPEGVADAVADAMFALSSPTRVRILALLRDGPRGVSELTNAMQMEQSAVSHQLRVLREHRIVSVERLGRRRMYALHDEDVAVLLDTAVHHATQLHPARARRTAGGSA